jgi:hypothetical protein
MRFADFRSFLSTGDNLFFFKKKTKLHTNASNYGSKLLCKNNNTGNHNSFFHGMKAVEIVITTAKLYLSIIYNCNNTEISIAWWWSHQLVILVIMVFV